MSSAIGSTVPDTLRQAARGAQSLFRDVKDDLEDSIDKGRRLARGGRKAISRAATRVDQFADDNTALVAAASAYTKPLQPAERSKAPAFAHPIS